MDVELQLEILVAAVPLNVTVLDPRVDPKLRPVIVIDAPTAPVFGLKLDIEGAEPKAAIGRPAIKHSELPNKSEMRSLPVIGWTALLGV
jgi:hypothetical protein